MLLLLIFFPLPKIVLFWKLFCWEQKTKKRTKKQQNLRKLREKGHAVILLWFVGKPMHFFMIYRTRFSKPLKFCFWIHQCSYEDHFCSELVEQRCDGWLEVGLQPHPVSLSMLHYWPLSHPGHCLKKIPYSGNNRYILCWPPSTLLHILNFSDFYSLFRWEMRCMTDNVSTDLSG